MTETTPSARRRLLGALATAVLVVAALGHAPASADACNFQKGWEALTPDFPEGTPEITSVSAYRFDAYRVFVSNDRSIMYSADGGCSFREGMTLSELEGFTATDRITKVLVAPDEPTRVYALAEEAGPVKQPHVLLSLDGGADWAELVTGLEGALGPAVDLAVPLNDGPLYLLVGGSGEGGIQTPASLYRNEGEVWQPAATFGEAVAVPGVLENQADLRGVEVDPNAVNDVWVYGDSGLHHSIDGGLTFEQRVTSPISALDVVRSNNGLYRVLALAAGEPKAYFSFDAIGFRSVSLPGSSQALAAGRTEYEVMLVTDGGRVHRVGQFFAPGSTADLRSPRPVRDVSIGLASRVIALYGQGATTVERLFLPGPPPVGDPDLPPLPDLVVGLPPGASLEKPALFPDSNRIFMTPGERRRVPVRLLLPGTRKVDVFFLLDTSGSMGEEIAGTRTALGRIAKELVEGGVDAQFGLGQFRGYDRPPAYERVRDIGPAQAVLDGLGELGALGSVEEESMLSALQQIATGAGQAGHVPPGQNAHFRKGSLRVIIHATDETFYYRSPSPSADTVEAALKSVGALQVGLAFQEFPPPPPPISEPLRPPYDPVTGLRDMATRTNAVAPAQGVDCDGDDAQDVSPGDPLVCVIDPSHSEEASVMAPAIVGLLLGLKDEADVHIEAKGPAGTVLDVAPASRHVDFKQNSDLSFAVTLSCPVGSIGRSFPIALRAVGRDGITLATAGTNIVCGERVVPALPIIPPLIFQPPIPQQPVPNSQPNPQPQPNAQGAFAAQRQEQHQLVYGYVNPARKPEVAPERAGPSEDKFAMSEYRENEAGVPPAVTYLTGGAMAAAFVVATRRRTRAATVRVATVRTRGRNR